MPGCPVTNDARATPKAEGQEFAPELGRVAASFVPAAPENGFEWIEHAVARGLLPERRVAELSERRRQSGVVGLAGRRIVRAGFVLVACEPFVL